MIITLTILSCIIAGLLTGIVYYRNKYWNYLDIAESANNEVLDTKKEMLDTISSETSRMLQSQKEFEEETKKKFKKALIKKKEQIKKEYQEKYNLLAEELEQDYNNACEEVKTELFEQLEKVDNALAEHAENLAMKNILTFSCSCSKDLIPCPIDFTKENTFTCSKCGSKYRVAINANPILIGRAISDEQFSDLLEKRLNENKK